MDQSINSASTSVHLAYLRINELFISVGACHVAYSKGSTQHCTRDSRGYWDGDTLVVETRNFSYYTSSLRNTGTGKEKFLTERFTRKGYSSLEYEWTLEDPATFTDKISAVLPMAKVDGQLYEYACQEGNYGLLNILRGARAEEARNAE